MSKLALSRLLKDITPNQIAASYDKGTLTPFQGSLAGSSKPYRKQVLDKNSQIFDIGDVAYVSEQLKLEIINSQPDLASVLSDDVFNAAAKKLISTFDISGAKNKQGDYYIYGTYDSLQKNLAKANKAAFVVIEAAIKAGGASIGTRKTLKGKEVSNISSTLTSPDHVLTNAEVRFTEVFNRGLSDPLATIQKLREFGGLKPATETAFVDEFTKITSYYTADGAKAFDISIGAKVKIRSTKDNEAAGTNITLAITEQLKEAAAKAIRNNDWADQDGSDSYKKYLIKTFENIAVAHGAKGTKQKIDKAKNEVGKTKRTTIKVSKPKSVAKKAIPKAKSLINLQSIVNYINKSLPEAVRKNMGEGSLVNRSGRFSNSARVVNITQTEQGYPSIAYTYQRSPYDVFDPVLGKSPWNTPGRDPRKIIDKSVRDIAKELAIGRFYTRRA